MSPDMGNIFQVSLKRERKIISNKEVGKGDIYFHYFS